MGQNMSLLRTRVEPYDVMNCIHVGSAIDSLLVSLDLLHGCKAIHFRN